MALSKEENPKAPIIPPPTVKDETPAEQMTSDLPPIIEYVIEAVSVVSPWSEPTEHPESGVTVLCELNPHIPVLEREYVKGQFDHHTGNFFTTKDGPYKILDVARWMEVK